MPGRNSNNVLNVRLATIALLAILASLALCACGNSTDKEKACAMYNDAAERVNGAAGFVFDLDTWEQDGTSTEVWRAQHYEFNRLPGADAGDVPPDGYYWQSSDGAEILATCETRRGKQTDNSVFYRKDGVSCYISKGAPEIFSEEYLGWIDWEMGALPLIDYSEEAVRKGTIGRNGGSREVTLDIGWGTMFWGHTRDLGINQYLDPAPISGTFRDMTLTALIDAEGNLREAAFKYTENGVPGIERESRIYNIAIGPPEIDFSEEFLDAIETAPARNQPAAEEEGQQYYSSFDSPESDFADFLAVDDYPHGYWTVNGLIDKYGPPESFTGYYMPPPYGIVFASVALPDMKIDFWLESAERFSFYDETLEAGNYELDGNDRELEFIVHVITLENAGKNLPYGIKIGESTKEQVFGAYDIPNAYTYADTYEWEGEEYTVDEVVYWYAPLMPQVEWEGGGGYYTWGPGHVAYSFDEAGVLESVRLQYAFFDW